MLRAEQRREGSEYGQLIQTCIKEGNIVPMEVTIKLLENAMRQTIAENQSVQGWGNGSGRFLIDGFPRQMDQAIKFEEDVGPSSNLPASCSLDSQVCPATTILYFSTTEEVMVSRLLERGKTSGRDDDNVESIKKRLGKYSYLNSQLISLQ